MSHITREDLERWWSRGDAADRARIVGHLAACDECIVRYGALMDARPAEAPAVTPPAVAARHGRRVFGTARVPWARRLRWHPARVGAAAAVAAVLALIVFAPTLRQPDAGQDLGIRGTRLTLVEPIGNVPPPASLRWASPIDAARFRVEIVDATGAELLAATVERQELLLPEDVRQRLQPGREYRWHVVALDRDGAPMLRSEVRSFVIATR